MNTDNMTISGETIDYGPCAFMEAFDPAAVYSSIDEGGRYSYANQPVVAEWNLARLAEALLPLLHDDQEQAVRIATDELGMFRQRYGDTWSAGMKAKLGLSGHQSDELILPLVDDLLALLTTGGVDYTAFFRSLSGAAGGETDDVRTLFTTDEGLDAWVQRWKSLGPDAAAMDRTNPAYIPRNHLVEEALTAATAGDLEPFDQLLTAVTLPFEERPGLERYTAGAPGDFGAYRTFCGT